MMSDLISRSWMMEQLDGLGDTRLIKRNFIALVTNAPTVDAVEVVRCRDCKHWLKDFTGCSDNVGRCEWANYAVGANGYCLYGEPKGDADHG